MYQRIRGYILGVVNEVFSHNGRKIGLNDRISPNLRVGKLPFFIYSPKINYEKALKIVDFT